MKKVVDLEQMVEQMIANGAPVIRANTRLVSTLRSSRSAGRLQPPDLSSPIELAPETPLALETLSSKVLIWTGLGTTISAFLAVSTWLLQPWGS